MKYREGFVTNSSSTCYICCICGEEVSGYDMGISDAGMVRCEYGHTFCEDHLLVSINEIKERFDESDDCYYDSYEIPTDCCPICTFNTLLDSDAASFLMKKLNMTDVDVLNKMSEEFKTYEDFKEYLRKKD